MTWLTNAWYVAGFSSDVAPGQLVVRTLLGQAVVFFRNRDGELRALEDRCAHRFAPLSMGKLCDGAVECAYHGLRFDGAGRCVHNPHGEGVIPLAAQVRAFEVREQHGLVWWWAGEAARADDALIPDYAFLSAGPSEASGGYLQMACHYQLLLDNLLDLTHTDFLHAGSLGSGALTRTTAVVTDPAERSLAISWHSSGHVAPAVFDRHLREPGRPADQWAEVTWHAPSTIRLDAGATLQGEDRLAGRFASVVHAATPLDSTHTHQWYIGVNNFGGRPEEQAHRGEMIHHIFSTEDKPMLEAQQRALQGHDFWAMKPVLLRSDAGAIRLRRKLAALIELESSEQLAAAK